MVLYLLSSSPKNGVELMDGVQSITRGWWRPTPGSIYPLLSEMTKQGLVVKKDDGRYELTQKGRSQSQGHFDSGRRGPQSAGDMVNQMEGFVSYFEDLKGSKNEQLDPHRGKLKELAKRLREVAGPAEDQKE